MKKEYKNLLEVFLKEAIKYLIFLVVFIVISALLLTKGGSAIEAFDNAIIVFKNEHIVNNLLTSIMTAITYVGSYGSYIFIIAVSLIIFRKKLSIPLFMGCAVGGAGIINKIVKYFIKRPRPIEALIAIPDSYSFPSGHTMCSIVFYMYLIYLLRKYVKDNTIKNIFTVVLVCIPVLIGLSRVYLGVHFASDVIAGAVIGVVTFFPFIKITNAIKGTLKW